MVQQSIKNSLVFLQKVKYNYPVTQQSYSKNIPKRIESRHSEICTPNAHVHSSICHNSQPICSATDELIHIFGSSHSGILFSIGPWSGRGEGAHPRLCFQDSNWGGNGSGLASPKVEAPLQVASASCPLSTQLRFWIWPPVFLWEIVLPPLSVHVLGPQG